MADPVSELAAAAAEYDRLHERVQEVGEADLARVNAAHDGATDLLDRYEERATDWDDFGGYVEFQNTFVEFVEGLDDDLPRRAAFEAADETFQRSRLKEKHFAQARRDLEPARELATLKDEWESAQERYEEARRAAERRDRELTEDIERHERLLELGEADLDAPVEELRDPIAAYNDAVREAFREYLSTASARDVLGLFEVAAGNPLVDVRAPPTRLHEYLNRAAVGTEPVSKLLSYADYSASKLDHYVENPAELKRHVATNRTYLDRLSAAPFTVAWPPVAAATLRYQLDEYVPLIARFAPEAVVARARDLRERTREEAWYDRLRASAHARADLSDGERERLRSGAVAAELEALREERARVRDALETDGSR
jgi:hypothetical protein